MGEALHPRACQAWPVRPFPGGGQAYKKNLVLSPGHFAEYDPFLMMAEDWMQEPGGFREHPHRGFETVTIVLDGACCHADSKGNTGVLGVGDVQWMTAGSGVVHSEMPLGTETCHLLQLWLNLPAAHKMMPPRYQDVRAKSMPVHRTPGVVARVFSGSLYKAVSDTKNVVPVLAFIADINPGCHLVVPLQPAWTVITYVLSGAAMLLADGGGGGVFVPAGQAVLLAPRQPASASSPFPPASTTTATATSPTKTTSKKASFSPSNPASSPSSPLSPNPVADVFSSSSTAPMSTRASEAMGAEGRSSQRTSDGARGSTSSITTPTATATSAATVSPASPPRPSTDSLLSSASTALTDVHARTSGNVVIAVDASILSETRVVFFAGPPLHEPVCAEGPFVMTSHAEIVQAHRDYLDGRFH